MVNKSIILTRVEQIEKHLEKIKKFKKIKFTEFKLSSEAQDIVEYNLFQVINHIIDILEHIVVDENYGYPESSYMAAEFLYNEKVFNKSDMTILKRMIGFRNVIAHDYIDLNKRMVFDVLQKGDKNIKKIIKKIVNKFI